MGGAASSEDQARADFKRFDVDKNDAITFQELLVMFQQLDPAWTKQQVELLFNAVDANRNGSISVEEFVNWVMMDATSSTFKGSSQDWKTGGSLTCFPGPIKHDILRMVYEAGMWANQQVGNPAAGNAKKAQVNRLHNNITQKGVLSPGACTQLRDMAVACGLMVVAEFRLKGEGLEDAEKFLKRSIYPNPRMVEENLWRAAYDLCWASARHACFLHLLDGSGRENAKKDWCEAASVCFGRKYTMDNATQIFLSFQSEEKFSGGAK